jgi:hypothetical protein
VLLDETVHVVLPATSDGGRLPAAYRGKVRSLRETPQPVVYPSIERPQHMLATVLSIFAGVRLLLTAVGLYGTTGAGRPGPARGATS